MRAFVRTAALGHSATRLVVARLASVSPVRSGQVRFVLPESRKRRGRERSAQADRQASGQIGRLWRLVAMEE